MSNDKQVSRNDSAGSATGTHTQVRDGVLAVPGELKTALWRHARFSIGRVATELARPARRWWWRSAGFPPRAASGCRTSRAAAGGTKSSDQVWRSIRSDSAFSASIIWAPAPIPPGRATAHAFPTVSAYDQAELLLRLINHLGIASLRAIAGASYGGMVALAFGERYPDRVARLLVISAADRAHPMASAWRVVQRRIVKFAIESGKAGQGLELARALAMATYRSPEEFAARFGGAPRRNDDDRFSLPVEEYLFARGAEYAKSYRPESFVCLSESIDLHRVDASRIFAPVTAVAVREDQLVPLADMRAMVARLPNAELHEISSVYGHDAFLKENRRLAPIFANVLNEQPGIAG